MGRLWRSCEYPAVERTRIPCLAALTQAVSVLGRSTCPGAALAGALRGFSGVRVAPPIVAPKTGLQTNGSLFFRCWLF